jgi:hypothetical protein
MQPCPTCGRTDVDAAGYCQGCGTYRGAPGYDQGGQYGGPSSAPPYGGQASGPPYGGPSSAPPYGGQASGPPYGGQASGPPYGGQPYQPDPYQAQPQQPYGGYPDPNYPPSFAPPPATGRRPSTVPLIVLSVVAVILVVGIVAVVVARSGSGGGSDDPTNGPTAAPADTVAAGLDKCVVGKWRISSTREKVEFEGTLVEFTASGGTAEFRGDGTGTIDYGSGVVYRGTVENQAVTITLTGNASFSYKTVDKTITYSNPSADGEAVLRVNGAVTTSVPLDMDTKPNSYTCSGSGLTLTTDLATTELRK